jgi:hypothetical protein
VSSPRPVRFADSESENVAIRKAASGSVLPFAIAMFSIRKRPAVPAVVAHASVFLRDLRG